MAITNEQEQKLRALISRLVNPQPDNEEAEGDDEEEDDGRGDNPWGEDGAMYAYERGMTHGHEDGYAEGIDAGSKLIAEEILDIIGK